MAFSWSVTFLWMFSTVPKWDPLRWLYKFRNKKSQRLMSEDKMFEELLGCFSFPKSYWFTENAVWPDALSWCSIHLSLITDLTQATLFQQFLLIYCQSIRNYCLQDKSKCLLWHTWKMRNRVASVKLPIRDN